MRPCNCKGPLPALNGKNHAVATVSTGSPVALDFSFQSCPGSSVSSWTVKVFNEAHEVVAVISRDCQTRISIDYPSRVQSRDGNVILPNGFADTQKNFSTSKRSDVLDFFRGLVYPNRSTQGTTISVPEAAQRTEDRLNVDAINSLGETVYLFIRRASAAERRDAVKHCIDAQ